MRNILGVIIALALLLSGCGGGQDREDRGFFTSGNREADQRADQRMAKSEQLQSEQKAGGADNKKVQGKNGAPVAEAKRTLFERLGGEQGISQIVDDFTTRALADPRVNWQRKGVTQGGMSLNRNKPVTWDANSGNVAQLKKHINQFFALATGGPAKYDGKEMRQAHAGLHITNPEFDAAVGDLKASLDKLQIPNAEQKELLSIVESTRPQVVEER